MRFELFAVGDVEQLVPDRSLLRQSLLPLLSLQLVLLCVTSCDPWPGSGSESHSSEAPDDSGPSQKRRAAEKYSVGIEASSHLKNESLDPGSLTRPVQVTKPVLDRYQRHLFHPRKADGEPLTFRAQESLLVALRGYFKWLTKENVLLSNPASEIERRRACATWHSRD